MAEDEIDDEILSRYYIWSQLGKGAYGIVWKAVDKLRPNRVVAVKKICDAFRSPEDAVRTFREVEILLRLNEFPHPNIVRLTNVVPARNDADVYLVFDYIPNSLMSVISYPVLDTVQRQYIGYQLIRAIHFLHSADVVHRDMKPSNVLIDKNCSIKLCDFGLARICTDSLTDNSSSARHGGELPIMSPLKTTGHSSLSNRPDEHGNYAQDDMCMTDYIATRWYRAPELLFHSRSYGKPVDIWAVGCILLELEAREPAFPGQNNEHQMELTLQLTGMPSPAVVEKLCIGSAQAHVVYENESSEFFGKSIPPTAVTVEELRMSGVTLRTLAQRMNIVPLSTKVVPTPTKKTQRLSVSSNQGFSTPARTSSLSSANHSSLGLSASSSASASTSSSSILSTYSRASLGIIQSAGLDPSSPKALLYDLLSKCLIFDPSQRLSAKEMMEHPYFAPFFRPESEPTCSKKMKLRVTDLLETYSMPAMGAPEYHREIVDPENDHSKVCTLMKPLRFVFDSVFYRNQLYHLMAEVKARQLPSTRPLASSRLRILTRSFGVLDDTISNLFRHLSMTMEDVQAWDTNTEMYPPLTLEQMKEIDQTQASLNVNALEYLQHIYDSPIQSVQSVPSSASSMSSSTSTTTSSSSSSSLASSSSSSSDAGLYKTLKSSNANGHGHGNGKQVAKTNLMKRNPLRPTTAIRDLSTSSSTPSSTSSSLSLSLPSLSNTGNQSQLYPGSLRNQQFSGDSRPSWTNVRGKLDIGTVTGRIDTHGGSSEYPGDLDDLGKDKMDLLCALERFSHSHQHVFFGEFVDMITSLYQDALSYPYIQIKQRLTNTIDVSKWNGGDENV